MEANDALDEKLDSVVENKRGTKGPSLNPGVQTRENAVRKT